MTVSLTVSVSLYQFEFDLFFVVEIFCFSLVPFVLSENLVILIEVEFGNE